MPRRPQPSDEQQPTGQWIIRDVPRDVMARIKMAAALHRTSVKQLIMNLALDFLHRLDREGIQSFDPLPPRWIAPPIDKQSRDKRSRKA